MLHIYYWDYLNPVNPSVRIMFVYVCACADILGSLLQLRARAECRMVLGRGREGALQHQCKALCTALRGEEPARRGDLPSCDSNSITGKHHQNL